jgi:hypothetical protein
VRYGVVPDCGQLDVDQSHGCLRKWEGKCRFTAVIRRLMARALREMHGRLPRLRRPRAADGAVVVDQVRDDWMADPCLQSATTSVAICSLDQTLNFHWSRLEHCGTMCECVDIARSREKPS